MKKVIHAWLLSAADEDNYDKYYTVHTKFGLAVLTFWSKLFYDYVEILDEDPRKS